MDKGKKEGKGKRDESSVKLSAGGGEWHVTMYHIIFIPFKGIS